MNGRFTSNDISSETPFLGSKIRPTHFLTGALLPAHNLWDHMMPTIRQTVFKPGGTLNLGFDLALDSVHYCALGSPGNVVGIKWNQASLGMILSFSTCEMGCLLY